MFLFSSAVFTLGPIPPRASMPSSTFPYVPDTDARAQCSHTHVHVACSRDTSVSPLPLSLLRTTRQGSPCVGACWADEGLNHDVALRCRAAHSRGLEARILLEFERSAPRAGLKRPHP